MGAEEYSRAADSRAGGNSNPSPSSGDVRGQDGSSAVARDVVAAASELLRAIAYASTWNDLETEPARVIEYREDLTALTADQLRGGFFEGWPSPPSPELHLAHLRGAEVAIVAVDAATGQVVGFVTAIGDGALTAFIPLIEVLPAYRGSGIGTELVRLVLARLGDRYSIDLVCDPDLVTFYERFGGVTGTAMLWRNRDALTTRTRR
jgi:ribosomal protein S18 acetylase RimI-like enzyme